MRNSAEKCLQRAKDLIAKDEEASAIYACLELRFCIEYITYSQLQMYRNEVPDNILEKWTPRQIISELLMVDPDADKSVVISSAIENASGIPVPESEMRFLGEDRRFSLKWASKQHNALGNFLHAPTLHQIKKGETPTKNKILKKVREVTKEIDQILDSQVFNVKAEFYCGIFECKFCNTEIKYGTEKINKGIVICQECKATYDIYLKQNNTINFKARESEYKCHSCGTSNLIGSHLIYLDNVLSCTNCDAKAKIQYNAVPI